MDSKTENTTGQQDDLSQKLSRTSIQPGVYLMKDHQGDILYVGKARNLKKRLASYFSRTGRPDIKTWVLLKKVATFDTIITSSEKEALILESNLIKQYRPKYNINLKDDKRFPSLRLDIRESFPRPHVVRKTSKDGALYFGPFSSSQALRQTLKFIHKTFMLRTCASRNFKNRIRPCLNYQMGRCLAPCCLDVDRNVYEDIVREVILFLKGRTPELIRKIQKDMKAAADAQNFECAAILRDKMFALEKTLERQVVVTTDFKDRDIISVAGSPDLSVVTLLTVRGGFLLGTRHTHIRETMATDQETVSAFIRQYYEHAPFIPKEILVPCDLEDFSLLEDWLAQLKGVNVSIRCPKRGEKQNLIALAAQNAAHEFKMLTLTKQTEIDILIRIQKRLNLAVPPIRIECFDISNLSGTSPVAAMVVFENGKAKPSDYRHYKINTVSIPDDYAAMAEVLKRRYGKGDAVGPYPDLLLVDGGKGQLNVAVAVSNHLGLSGQFPVAGIAKRNEAKGESRDKVYVPGRANPIHFGREGDLLLFLQRIRDEAHRFAITFHRKRRAKASMRSILDEIPGIGIRRKKILLEHFTSIKKIRSATLVELSALPGMTRKAAKSLKDRLVSEDFSIPDSSR